MYVCMYACLHVYVCMYVYLYVQGMYGLCSIFLFPVDMEIKDVREYEKVKHQETNEKVVGSSLDEDCSDSSKPATATRHYSAPS